MNTNSKLRVALFFGGVSSEHDVSCVSASAWRAHWVRSPARTNMKCFPWASRRMAAGWPRPHARGYGRRQLGAGRLHALRAQPGPRRPRHDPVQDGRWKLPRGCAHPSLHGKNGEDGTIQGLLELAASPMWAAACWAALSAWTRPSPTP